MADEKEPSFKVSDRRQFNPDGTPRESAHDERGSGDEARRSGGSDAAGGSDRATAGDTARVISFPGEKGKERGAAPKAAQGQPTSGSSGKPATAGGGALPQASLEGLVNMLAVEAVMHLGLIENPMGGRGVDLEAARHVIDMLGVIQNKTQGNLTDDEAELLDSVLADLRMQFVGISRGR
jgi:hypothetical protein